MWNFVGDGAEHSPVGIRCSAGGVYCTTGIRCTAGVCCCTAGLRCSADVLCTAGMQSIMVRGGLPSRLLAQNNSHHERLLIGGGAADLGELREAAGAIAKGLDCLSPCEMLVGKSPSSFCPFDYLLQRFLFLSSRCPSRSTPICVLALFYRFLMHGQMIFARSAVSNQLAAMRVSTALM